MVRLLTRRTVLVPTFYGWLLLATILLGFGSLWIWRAEKFFSVTERKPAEILIVEGWIGMPGVAAARAEFENGSYDYLVTAGTFTDNRWGTQRLNYATMARDYLLRKGFPADKLIEAPAGKTLAHRTYASASAVRHVLASRQLRPTAVNVLTLGMHSRRTRLIFARVLGPEIAVGIISWTPDSQRNTRWWQSSERAEELIKETVAFPAEWLLKSGRGWMGPKNETAEPPVQPNVPR